MSRIGLEISLGEGMQLKWVVEAIEIGEWIVQVNMECFGPPGSVTVDGNEYLIRPRRALIHEKRWVNVKQDSATVANYEVPLTREQTRAIEEHLEKNPPPTPPAISPYPER